MAKTAVTEVNRGEDYFDLLIIGGGAAGIMAAITAARKYPDYRIGIIDRTFALGRKILVCGAGRCNVTNVNLSPENYYGDKDFATKILQQFPLAKIQEFFADLGVELYVEQKTDIGKIFPTTNQAQTIIGVLESELELLGVEIYLNHEVSQIVPTHAGQSEPELFQLAVQEIDRSGAVSARKNFQSKYLILAAGGKTYPALGANGSGYTLAESLGHTVEKPVPSALPLVIDSTLHREVAGLRHDCEVWSYIGGNPAANQGNLRKFTKTDTDNLMFTSYGLSGPVILNLSREISIRINREAKSDCYLRINLVPGKSLPEIRAMLTEKWQKRPQQALVESLYGLLPNKLALAVCHSCALDPKIKVVDLRSTEVHKLLQQLGNWIVKVENTRSWEEAEFTAGGIITTEMGVNLLSKLHKNLYFAGEIINIDGDVGGFNLSWAWATGSVAGKLSNN